MRELDVFPRSESYRGSSYQLECGTLEILQTYPDLVPYPLTKVCSCSTRLADVTHFEIDSDASQSNSKANGRCRGRFDAFISIIKGCRIALCGTTSRPHCQSIALGNSIGALRIAVTGFPASNLELCRGKTKNLTLHSKALFNLLLSGLEGSLVESVTVLQTESRLHDTDLRNGGQSIV